MESIETKSRQCEELPTIPDKSSIWSSLSDTRATWKFFSSTVPVEIQVLPFSSKKSALQPHSPADGEWVEFYCYVGARLAVLVTATRSLSPSCDVTASTSFLFLSSKTNLYARCSSKGAAVRMYFCLTLELLWPHEPVSHRKTAHEGIWSLRPLRLDHFCALFYAALQITYHLLLGSAQELANSMHFFVYIVGSLQSLQNKILLLSSEWAGRWLRGREQDLHVRSLKFSPGHCMFQSETVILFFFSLINK